MSATQYTWWIESMRQVQAMPMLIVIAIEIAILIACIAVVSWMQPPGKRRRSIWRGAILLSALLIFMETTGAGEFAWRVGSTAVRSTQSRDSDVNLRTFGDMSASAKAVGNSAPVTLPMLVLGLWIAGTAIAMIQLIRQRLMLRRVGKQIQPIQSGPVAQAVAAIACDLRIGAPRVGRLAQLQGPIVFGIAKPYLVIPENFESSFLESERTAVLFHEMEHLASRDPLWKLLGDLVVAVLWWHPLVWWMARQSKWASEEAADEACLSIPNGAFHLAQGLVRLADQFLPTRIAAAHSVASSPNSLSRRVARLLTLEIHGRKSALESPARKFFRTSAILLTLFGALAGSGFCRARAANGNLAGEWADCWQQSFVCAVMNTLGGRQENDSPVYQAVTSTKTDESVADAIGLTGSERTKYFELLAENRIRLKEFYKIKDFSQQRQEGLNFNRWWRGRLKEILSPEKHDAYMKYWQDQVSDGSSSVESSSKIHLLPIAPSAAFSPAAPAKSSPGPQSISSKRMKKTTIPNWKELAITPAQEELIGALERKLNPLRNELQRFKEKGDVAAMNLKSQEIQTTQLQELKRILNADQFEKLQKQLSTGAQQSAQPPRAPVAAGG